MADGAVKRFLNNSVVDNLPVFDGGTLLEWGQPNAKVPINVGMRATPTPVDINDDCAKDLVVGAWDGNIYVFENSPPPQGTDTDPDFRTVYCHNPGPVDRGRSSPVIGDCTGDGLYDILTGNTAGELWLSRAPGFSGYASVKADGSDIGVPSGWSRPYVCDFNGDGRLDVLVGAKNGYVYLFEGTATCPPQDPPTGVEASDGTYLYKIQVTWSAPPGAMWYEVWRSPGSSPPTRIAWDLVNTVYVDNRDTPERFHYWVRAENACGNVSDFSEEDSGWAATLSQAPTVSGWGLITLALLLLSGIAVKFGWRRRVANG